MVDKIVGYEQNPPFYLFGGGFYNNVSFASYFQCCRNDVVDDGRTVRSFVETAEFARAGLTDTGLQRGAHLHHRHRLPSGVRRTRHHPA